VVNCHLRLNSPGSLIANKYRAGKLKTTLKRELKVAEVSKKEAIDVSVLLSLWFLTSVEGLGLLNGNPFSNTLDRVKSRIVDGHHSGKSHSVKSFYKGGKNH